MRLASDKMNYKRSAKLSDNAGHSTQATYSPILLYPKSVKLQRPYYLPLCCYLREVKVPQATVFAAISYNRY